MLELREKHVQHETEDFLIYPALCIFSEYIQLYNKMHFMFLVIQKWSEEESFHSVCRFINPGPL